MAEHRPLSRLFIASGGLFAWAIQFTIIYGAAAIACERDLQETSVLGIGIVPFVILATTVGALAATGLLLAQALKERRSIGSRTSSTDRFLNHVALIAGGISLVSIAWQGLPGLIVPTCA